MLSPMRAKKKKEMLNLERWISSLPLTPPPPPGQLYILKANAAGSRGRGRAARCGSLRSGFARHGSLFCLRSARMFTRSCENVFNKFDMEEVQQDIKMTDPTKHFPMTIIINLLKSASITPRTSS